MTIVYCGLEQIVTFPFHLSDTLEMFLSNRPNLVNWCTPMPCLSDHDATAVAKLETAVKRKIYRWKKTVKKMKSEFNELKKTSFFNNCDFLLSKEWIWNNIITTLNNILESSVPAKMTSSRFKQQWINRGICHWERRNISTRQNQRKIRRI